MSFLSHLEDIAMSTMRKEIEQRNSLLVMNCDRVKWSNRGIAFQLFDNSLPLTIKHYTACARTISLTFVLKPSYSHGSCRHQGDGVGAAAPVDLGNDWPYWCVFQYLGKCTCYYSPGLLAQSIHQQARG